MKCIEKLHDTISLYWQWAKAEFTVAAPIPGHSKGRHLLVLAGVLPPYVSGGVYRPTSWLRFGGENGWRVSAVGLKLSNEITKAGEYLRQSIPQAVTIDYAPDAKIQPAWRYSPQLEGGFLAALQMYHTARDRYKNDPPSVIVATGPSFFSFVAGMWTAKYFSAYLVLDYRDEWTECPFNFVDKTSWDTYWEKRCQRRADKVFFTTKKMLDHQLKAFPELGPAKYKVHPNGWDSTDLTEVDGPKTPTLAEGLRYLTFIGNLTDYVMPQDFLTTFAAFLKDNPENAKRFGLRFVGLQSALAKAAINDFPFPANIKVEGFLAKPEAVRITRESFALLTLTSGELARYRPGKVIEYLASDRPILVYGAEGEVSDIVKELGAGAFVSRGDIKGLGAALEALSTGPSHQWQTPERKSWAANNSRRALAKEFFTCLGKLVSFGIILIQECSGEALEAFSQMFRGS